MTPYLTGASTTLPSNIVGMTSGFVSGGTLPDLILVTNNPNQNSLWVLANQSTSTTEAASFSAYPVADSAFAGTPVGVATGVLSTTGSASLQDIAVAYAATGTNESMVAVFRNLGTDLTFQGRDFGFQRTAVPGSSAGDYDAGQTNPTAIAVADLSGGKWNDIIVTNNDGRGTISVLEPLARPTPTSAPQPNDFHVSANVPDPAAVTGLTVSVALSTTSLADVTLTLIAPDGASITLLKSGAITGTEIGTVSPTQAVDPIVFDDNATRDIIDASGQTPIIGNFRPQSDYINTETLDSFVTQLAKSDPTHFNGQWTLRVTDSVTATTGFLQEFSLQFTTRMIVSKTEGTISPFSFNTTVDGNSLTTVVMPGALGNNYLPTEPTILGYSIASPLGIGPGLVMAQDDTLGPGSPFQGRIYAAFVGWYDVTEPGTAGRPIR